MLIIFSYISGVVCERIGRFFVTVLDYLRYKIFRKPSRTFLTADYQKEIRELDEIFKNRASPIFQKYFDVENLSELKFDQRKAKVFSFCKNYLEKNDPVLYQRASERSLWIVFCWSILVPMVLLVTVFLRVFVELHVTKFLWVAIIFGIGACIVFAKMQTERSAEASSMLRYFLLSKLESE
jgi:hypothetical protein